MFWYMGVPLPNRSTASGVDGMKEKACGLSDVEGEVIFLEGEDIGMGEEGQGGYFVLGCTFFSGDVLVKEKAV